MKHHVITSIYIFGPHHNELNKVPLFWTWKMEYANWTSETTALLAPFPAPATSINLSGCNDMNETTTSHCSSFQFELSLLLLERDVRHCSYQWQGRQHWCGRSAWRWRVPWGWGVCAGLFLPGEPWDTRLLWHPQWALFGLFMLTIVSAFFGFLAHIIRLPHLFGMMVGGILLNNLPVVGVARNISHEWSDVIRTCALVIVLIRGGLSMNESECGWGWGRGEG